MPNKKQKLELTWIGKDEQPKLEPRILIEDPDKSYGDKSTENMLIYGDNLLALKALEQDYAGKIKCASIDPPYNTGSAFEFYDDGLEHSMWLNLMKPRLEIIRTLLCNEGSVWIYIDDNELHYLKVLCDEVFGRDNFITTICVKMSHLSGVKMSHIEKKPPKIKEYILIYSKNKEFFSVKPIYEQVDWEDSLDRYNQFIINIEDHHSSWVVKPVRQVAIERKINVNSKIEYETFLIDNSKSIFRTARNKAIKKTDRKSEFTAIVSKTGLNKLIYKDEEVLFASDKMIEVDGQFIPANPIGDMWLDIGINNLHNEGGVEFKNGKKPEKAIGRIVEMSTNENDWILDSFLGSGTTAAVANKMNRKWIGIELGEHCHTHCIPRLQKVIDGTDEGGITESVNWKGGGGFKYYYLAPSLLNQDEHGNWIISKEYNAQMLAAALAKNNGFRFQPDESIYWKQGQSTEKDFIFTTTNFLTIEHLDKIHDQMGEDESLLICCKSYSKGVESKYSNISVKKIPQLLLGSCEFGKEDYSLNIVSSPRDENESEFIPNRIVVDKPKSKNKNLSQEENLFE